MHSTKKKGDYYEEAVLNEIRRELDSGILPYSKDLCQVFQKKKYRSSAGNYIEVDISIEVRRPGAKTYTLLIIFECKDYKSPISTLRYNDLAQKMHQIGAHKGFIFTTSRFQEGVIKQAEQAGIGLVIYKPGENPIFVLERGKITPEEIYNRVVCKGDYESVPFISIQKRKACTNVTSFLFRQVLEFNDEVEIIPYISDGKIQSIASSIRKRCDLNEMEPVKTDELIKILSRLRYAPENANLDSFILGICDFKTRTVRLNQELTLDSPRWRFTLAHEIGHIILHTWLFKREKKGILSDSENHLIVSENQGRIEYQANLFASYLLMPDASFADSYMKVRSAIYNSKNHPQVYVDDQQCNLEIYNLLLTKIGKKFNVSKQVVEFRLKKFNLVIDKRSRFGNVGHHLESIFD